MSALDAAALMTTMASVAGTLHKPIAAEETLGMIVASARETIRHAEYVGITIAHAAGDIETLAATDDIVYRIDTLQREVGQGPALDAATGAGIPVVDNYVLDTRWPLYRPRVTTFGIASQMGLELYSDDDAVGLLNLYATTPYAFEDQTAFVAALFATHAAHALGKASENHELLEAVATRQLIGEAVGVVMERYDLDEPHAFFFLTRVSQESHIPVVVLAQEFVSGGGKH